MWGDIMIRIGICDDEQLERDYLHKLVSSFFSVRNLPFKIHTYDSAENFIFEMDQLDILLLDIQMSGITGMDLARKIREYDKNLSIIFITGVSDYIAEGYDVNARHYLLKPVSEDKLNEVLDKALTSLQTEEKFLMVDTDNGKIKINFRDIYFLESDGHYINVNCLDAIYQVKSSLAMIEENLNMDFTKVHRSYIVNIKHISRITKSDIYLDNDTVIPLSRRRYQDVNQQFITYYKGAK